MKDTMSKKTKRQTKGQPTTWADYDRLPLLKSTDIYNDVKRYARLKDIKIHEAGERLITKGLEVIENNIKRME